jgi:hypothetical protein
MSQEEKKIIHLSVTKLVSNLITEVHDILTEEYLHIVLEVEKKR